jgi:hypothetical protein
MARAIGSASTFREIGPFRRRIYKNPTATAATTAMGKRTLPSVTHGRRQRRSARRNRARQCTAAAAPRAPARGTALIGPRADVTVDPLAPPRGPPHRRPRPFSHSRTATSVAGTGHAHFPPTAGARTQSNLAIQTIGNMPPANRLLTEALFPCLRNRRCAGAKRQNKGRSRVHLVCWLTRRLGPVRCHTAGDDRAARTC